VEQFKYLGTTLTDQISLQEEINSSLKSGNACCHLVQSRLYSSFLSKNTKTFRLYVVNISSRYSGHIRVSAYLTSRTESPAPSG